MADYKRKPKYPWLTPSYRRLVQDYDWYTEYREWVRTRAVYIGKTPDSLLKIGAKQLPLVVNCGVIAKNDVHYVSPFPHKNRTTPHTLTRNNMNWLPEYIERPVLIFKDPQKKNRISIVTDSCDKCGNPILVVIELNHREERHYVNRVISIYGKNRAFSDFIAQNGKRVQGYIPRNIAAGNLIAVNMKKAAKLFQSAGLQLPEREEFAACAVV